MSIAGFSWRRVLRLNGLRINVPKQMWMENEYGADHAFPDYEIETVATVRGSGVDTRDKKRPNNSSREGTRVVSRTDDERIQPDHRRSLRKN